MQPVDTLSALSGFAVFDVVGLRSAEQMKRIDATGRVTSVTPHARKRDRNAVIEFARENVRVLDAVPTVAPIVQQAIAVFRFRPGPKPAA